VDYHWEIFLWGDPPIKAQSDIDLGVPNTWFEYELEWWNEHSIIEDQVIIKRDKWNVFKKLMQFIVISKQNMINSIIYCIDVFA
jgi:hypothetical protein